MSKLMLVALSVAMAIAASTVSAEMKKVALGTEGAYPPFNWIDGNGELRGFDIDIGNALCAAAALDCAWVIQDWDGMIPGLLAKRFEILKPCVMPRQLNTDSLGAAVSSLLRSRLCR